MGSLIRERYARLASVETDAGAATPTPCHLTMATAATPSAGKNAGVEGTADVEQQLTNLVDAFERVDWRRVDDVSTAEAAALGEVLRGAEVEADE